MFFAQLFRKNNKSEQLSPKTAAKAQMIDNSTFQTPNSYVTQSICDGQFPIYLVSSTAANHQDCIIKAFPYDDDNKPHEYYFNEARFNKLRHPNVIQFYDTQDQKNGLNINVSEAFSYIVMEHAPHGDFYELIHGPKNYMNEKLVRTYFRQLIEGLEYLHANRVAHLDLKPENLLLGSDFTLKIADFDLSYMLGDEKILSKGTKSYRAPEIFKANTDNLQLNQPFAADIYSAGIILFALLTGGKCPYYEDKLTKGINMLNLMTNSNADFWREQCNVQLLSYSFFSKSFIELFNGMVRTNPEQRFTIQHIKQSKWYNGPVYSGSKLEKKVRLIMEKKKKHKDA